MLDGHNMFGSGNDEIVYGTHKRVCPPNYVRNAWVAERYSAMRSHAVMVASTDLDARRARLVVDIMI